MIDTHAHLDNEVYASDIRDVLDRAYNDGIERIIIPAIEVSQYESILELVETDERLLCGMGIHPHNAFEISESNINLISELCENEKVVAIGEIGLDYYYNYAPKDVQIGAFRDQLEVAKIYHLPVIVHNRDADEDVLKIIESEQDGNLSGVLHCFSSSAVILERAIDAGFYVSFTGNITFKNTKLKSIVEKAPLEKILLETDSPYMAPVPYRGKRNEPSYLKYIAEKIAEFKTIGRDEVIEMTTRNALKLFKLGLVFILFILTTGQMLSQSTRGGTNLTDEEALEEEYYNPYKKLVGFGPIIGFNTIVENYHLKEGEKKISNEGIIGYGGSISFCPIDFLVLEVAYIYSLNKKISEQWKDSTGRTIIEPNTHQLIEFSTHWIANPFGRVNVYATLGLSAIFNEYGTGIKENPTRGTNHFGINSGVGFYLNIDTPAGLFVPTLNWTLNFVLGRSNSTFVKKINQEPGYILESTEVNVFFSIPRFVLTWYPPL